MRTDTDRTGFDAVLYNPPTGYSLATDLLAAHDGDAETARDTARSIAGIDGLPMEERNRYTSAAYTLGLLLTRTTLAPQSQEATV